MKKSKGSPQAMTLEQIAAIRRAAASWRTGEDVREPRPDGQVRHIIEVLLGTTLRIGEVLALRLCDTVDLQKGMVIAVRGTVVLRTGHGAAYLSPDRAFGPSNRRPRVLRGRPPCPPGDGRSGRCGADDLCEP